LNGSDLPLRDGVSPSCVGVPAGPWPHLIDFLVWRFPNVSAATWLDRLARGDVRTDAGVAITPQQATQGALPAPSRLYYYREVANEPVIPFDAQVLYQDAHLLVADKPHFLPVTPSGGYLQHTLLVRLRRQLGLEQLAPLHRIDRDTAGLVLFSTQAATRATYASLFRTHQINKTYHAIAPWRPDLKLPLTRTSRIAPAGHFMLQQEVPGEPNAVTAIDVLKVQGALARYALKPVTGQRHQLRLHMLALGAPIVNDGLYPELTPEGQIDHAKPLQLLARELAFTDPITGEPRHFVSQRTLMF